MITLMTGVPGAGKTLKIVSDLAEKKDKEYQGYKIYTDGIPELAIDVTPFPDGCSVKNMHEWLKLPENKGERGTLVIIDEAQRVFPPRSSNSAAPPLVEWLHVHRHEGIDLILITQMPQRIDKQVRDLVGAHYHIHKTPLGVRMIYFWDYCANNPRSEFRNARPTPYKLNSRAFKLYKSAEMHTKVQTPKSRVLWVLPLALVFLLVFGYLSFTGLTSMGDTKAVEAVADKGTVAAVDVGQNLGKQVSAGQDRTLRPEMYVPAIPDKVESKPLYDAVRQVKTFEYPVACIAGGNSGCTCYTSQGTAISEINKKTCREYVKNGLPFNPYKDERQTAQNQAVDVSVRGTPAPSGEVLVMGGKSQQNLMYDGYVEAGERFR